MATTAPKLSPALDAMVERGLFDRLPVTFSTFFYEQIQEWDLLFPAERNYFRACAPGAHPGGPRQP